MRRKKAQSTIEFTILVSFMILIFSIFFLLIGQKLVELRTERNYEITKAIRDVVENEFRLARIAEDGYSRQFRLPSNVEGMQYTISMENNTEIKIAIQATEIYLRIPDNLIGNISKGLNNITKKEDMIVIVPA